MSLFQQNVPALEFGRDSLCWNGAVPVCGHGRERSAGTNSPHACPSPRTHLPYEMRGHAGTAGTFLPEI